MHVDPAVHQDKSLVLSFCRRALFASEQRAGLSMAFFGVTSLGDYQTLLKSQPASHGNAFCGISDQALHHSFDKFMLGASTQSEWQACSLNLESCDCILRESLLDILKDVLGRRASKQEFDYFFTHFDFDSDCIMTRDEFGRACASLMESIRNGGEQREWYSYSLKHADWLRHKRLPYSPQQTLTRDVTEAQRVGWHAAKPLPPKLDHKPAGSTDVTQREGRSLVDYYGQYTLIGLQR
eukprot:jgi/Ulvmu1/9330/UM050_0080.1